MASRCPTYDRSGMLSRVPCKSAALPLLPAVPLLPLLLIAGCQSKAAAPAPPPPPRVVRSSRLVAPPPREVAEVPLALREVSAEVGLEYRWALPDRPSLNLHETLGHGAAFLDFDRDGWVDVFLVGERPALFRNLKNGRFQRIDAGLDRLRPAPYVGVAVGDYDRDGYPDLMLTAFRGGTLLHNEKGRALRDVTREAGLSATLSGWSTAASFADLDRDGLLDLIVARYIDYDPARRIMCVRNGTDNECGPVAYTPQKPLVYRNLGGGRFREVGKEWGFDASAGRTLAVVAADLDLDGQPEVVMANDLSPGDLFVRRPAEVRFENQGVASGTAFNRLGQLRGGMGVDVGDYDQDGMLEIVEMGFSYQGANLFHRIGPHVYKDLASDKGVKVATFPWVSFGSLFLDLDNDGWLDLFITNGHIYKESPAAYNSPFLQPLVLLYNYRGTFYNLPAKLTGRAAEPMLGRGLAAADYDQDGRLDLLVVDDSGHVVLLHNETRPAGHYLSLRLLDRHGQDAYGATLLAQVGGRTRVASCHADGSYISSSEPRIHLGLGAAAAPEVPVAVQWLSGRRERFGPLAADRRVELREGTGREVARGERWP